MVDTGKQISYTSTNYFQTNLYSIQSGNDGI